MKLQNQALSNDIANTICNITKTNPSIVRVRIFGSYARGENNQDSDIDILYEHGKIKSRHVANTIMKQSGSQQPTA